MSTRKQTKVSPDTVSLRLVGLSSYNQPKYISRIVRRGDIISGLPRDFADDLLQMGTRDSEGDLIKPTWIEVETPADRVADNDDDDTAGAQQASQGAEGTGQGAPAGGNEDDDETTTQAAAENKPAGKPASQRSNARRSTTSK